MYDGHDAIQARIEELNRQLGVDSGNSELGGGAPTPGNQPSTGSLDEDYGIPEEGIDQLGPVGALFVAVVLGGYLLFSNPLSDSMSTIRWGIIATSALIVVAIGLMAYREYRDSGVGGAASWLFGDGKDGGSTTQSSGEKNVKTPPAPESLKNDLIFDRAELECEWCEDHVDQPEVHHIEPRSEGGPNTPSNLAVLCPNCHEKADRGAISRSKLEAKVRRQID